MLRLARLAVVLPLAAGLAACQLTQSTGLEHRPAAQVPAPAVNMVTVAPGDTVYRIATRSNVSVRAMIEANRLSPPYRLLPGQRLIVPAVAEHVVKPGDTLHAIAHRYGTTTADIAGLNGLRPPSFVIKVGQRLTLPAAAPTPEPLAVKAERRAPAVEAAPLSEPSAEPMPTLTGSRVLMVANSPALAGAAPQTQTARPAEAAQPAAPVQTVAATSVAPAPAAKPSRKQEESFAPLAEPPVMRGGFAWPARGRIVARFGPLGKGQHNDGINIEVPRGAPVRAAADGVVAYAGNELRGFGNLLLIKHSGGWMSAYGHNDDLLVRRGDKVKRGQVIAKAGATGSVRSPQLHFELRKNADAVDPLKHLPEYKASAAGGAG